MEPRALGHYAYTSDLDTCYGGLKIRDIARITQVEIFYPSRFRKDCDSKGHQVVLGTDSGKDTGLPASIFVIVMEDSLQISGDHFKKLWVRILE
ncbi:hypothetical protein Tco_0636792 [Tanacetum coccineum]